MFLNYFLYLLLVNLTLSASFEEKSTYREFDCFLIVGDNELDILKGNNLADKTTKDNWNSFRKAADFVKIKALSCFLK